MDDAEAVADTLARLRARRPLVHCITNWVTAGLVANALLAVGAVPAMVEGIDEVASFTARADALAVNLGTLTPQRADAMRLAAATASGAGVPWVLDPVAAGALPNRAALARTLLREHRPAVVRGNASEIPALLSLPGEEGTPAAPSGRGPDVEEGAPDPLPAAREVAAGYGVAVAVTGVLDRVVDRHGRRLVSVRGGHPLMAQVSGVGCAATALVAACCAVESDAVRGASHALAMLGAAGMAAARHAPGPGSFALALLDALSCLDGPTLAFAELTEEALAPFL